MSFTLSCLPLSGPEGEACASGCVQCGISGFKQGGPQKLPEGGEVLAPWVYVILNNGKSHLTVGNHSTPGNNEVNHNAVISSFNFGHSNGFEGSFVVHDQQGSQFGKFVEDIVKDPRCLDEGAVTIEAQFGWMKSYSKKPVGIARSHCINGYLDSVDVNFSQGKFVYEITFKDLMNKAPEMGDERHFGTDGSFEGKYLRDAIVELLTEGPPPRVASVKFLKAVANGNTTELVPMPFEKGDTWTNENGRSAYWKGVKDKWRANGVDKLNTANNWLKDWLSEEKKGWVGTYNWEVKGGEVIFWSSSNPNCGENVPWEKLSIGTYIVNGGKQSSVIEFNPKIRWNFGMASNTGGGASNTRASGTEGDKVQGLIDCETLKRANNPGAGQTTSVPVTEGMENIEGTRANPEANLAQTKSALAIDIYPPPITAELVIVGDPTLSTIFTTAYKNLSIIFVNPYHILSNGNQGNWMLAKPACNIHLTNNAWLIKSISHTIEAGTYKTSLTLYLSAPGVDLNTGEPLGGNGSGGWQPPNNCPSSAT